MWKNFLVAVIRSSRSTASAVSHTQKEVCMQPQHFPEVLGSFRLADL